MFSVVNAVVLKPLGYAHAERLVWIVTYDDRAPIRSIEVHSAAAAATPHAIAVPIDAASAKAARGWTCTAG